MTTADLLRSLLILTMEMGIFFWVFRSLCPEKLGLTDFAACAVAVCFMAYLYLSRFLFSFYARFLYRAAIYYAVLRVAGNQRRKRSLYFALFITAIFTICQNITSAPIIFTHVRRQLETGLGLTGTVLSALLHGAFALGVFLLVHRNRSLRNIQEPSRPEWGVLGLIILLVLYEKQILYEASRGGMEQTPAFTVFSVLLQVSQLGFLIFFENFIQKQKEGQALQMQMLANRYRMESVQQMAESEKEIRHLHHDMKNHLMTIRHLAASSENGELDRYLSQLLQETEQPELVIRTGSAVLDGFVAEKMRKMRENRIECDVIADFSLGGFIGSSDVCTLFGNLLDNALEACCAMPEGEARRIRLRAGPVAGQMQITVSNSFHGEIAMNGSLPATTKKDPEFHGIGLQNVKRTTERYGGVMRIDAAGGMFLCSILIPMP